MKKRLECSKAHGSATEKTLKNLYEKLLAEEE